MSEWPDGMILKNILCLTCGNKTNREIREIEYTNGKVTNIDISPCAFCGYPEPEAMKVARERIRLERISGVNRFQRWRRTRKKLIREIDHWIEKEERK